VSTASDGTQEDEIIQEVEEREKRAWDRALRNF
jgi:hypothetical protein